MAPELVPAAVVGRPDDAIAVVVDRDESAVAVEPMDRASVTLADESEEEAWIECNELEAVVDEPVRTLRQRGQLRKPLRYRD